MTDRELMQQALDALDAYSWEQVQVATNALRNRLAQPEQTLTCVCGAVWEGELMVHAPRNRLAQPEQEPVAWYHAEKYKTHFTTEPSHDLIGKYWQPLYTHPPQRPWVGLTDEDVAALQDFAYADDVEFIRHIEAQLREKNT